MKNLNFKTAVFQQSLRALITQSELPPYTVLLVMQNVSLQIEREYDRCV